MLIVVSPAKRLDWSERDEVLTQPEFREDAVHLASVARDLSVVELQKLMSISEKLAVLNRDRFRDFAANPAADLVRPAALAFDGDTYQGLEATSLETEELDWAQDHLRILSGLYGVLRPRDAMQAYRLEMGSRLKTEKGKNLYAYWGDRIAQALQAQAAKLGTDTLVNCASQEYFGAVDLNALGLRVITPVFMEDKEGGPKIVSFYAKKARGAMARFIIQRRLTDATSLTEFDVGGYVYRPDLSELDKPVFVRPS